MCALLAAARAPARACREPPPSSSSLPRDSLKATECHGISPPAPGRAERRKEAAMRCGCKKEAAMRCGCKKLYLYLPLSNFEGWQKSGHLII